MKAYNVTIATPEPITAEAFYRNLLEQICQDKRRTRARRLAESGLIFWDSMNEAARTHDALKTEKAEKN